MKRITPLLIRPLCSALACVALAGPGRADTGRDVVLVYNTRLDESKAVADHYAEKRGVPAGQIIGLRLPDTEEISRAEYAQQLEKPLLAALRERALFTFENDKLTAAKIRHAILCYGVPVKIRRDVTWREAGAVELPETMRGRNEAAVDSELALLPRGPAGHRLNGVVDNPVFNTTNAAAIHPTNGVLMVARLDGPTAEIAKRLVDRALWAETNGWCGRAFFDLRGLKEGGYLMGDEWLTGAAGAARRAGFETVIDTNAATFGAGFPMSQIAIYAGWYDETVSGPFTMPVVEFMPGAFAYHLHSFSAAILRDAARHWVGPLLARGAAATMGSVYEPYLAGTPRVDVLVARLADGFSYGEAAAAAQSSFSWQTTVVGDPLYRPFGRPPREVHEDLARRKDAMIEWSHLRVVNLNLARGTPVAEMIGYLRGIPETPRSPVLLEKLGDLFQAGGQPLEGAQAWDLALKQKPSSQQATGLLLKLARELAALGRQAEARKVWEHLLQNAPNHPDREQFREQLKALER